MVIFALLTLVCFIPITSGEDLRVHRYVTRPNIQLQGILEEPSTLRSKIECVLVCSRSSSCYSVFWHSVKPRCRLSGKDVAHYVHYVQRSSFPEYDTLGEIVYPVAAYRGPEGRHSLTFAQAVEFCEYKGSHILNRSELMEAWESGFELCTCAWLAEGINGVILQQPTPGCHPWSTAGFTECKSQDKADVWCEFK